MQIRWKSQALKDLEAIENYYLDVAPEFATILVDEIFSRTKRLQHSSLSGRKVPELNDASIREIMYHSYRIIYRYSNDEKVIDILTVLHTAQDF